MFFKNDVAPRGLGYFTNILRGLIPTATDISPLRGSSAPTKSELLEAALGGHASGMPLRKTFQLKVARATLGFESC